MGLTMKKMKEWLRTSATEIKIRRTMHKQYQRDGLENSNQWVDGHWVCSKPRHLVNKYSNNLNELWKLKREYRHRHIAYSELRGKTRSQIEASYPYEGQSIYVKPNEKRIQKIKNEIIKKTKAQKESKSSASGQKAEGSGF